MDVLVQSSDYVLRKETTAMKYAKRDVKGNVLGHYEPTDEQVAAQEVWTHKVREEDRAKTRSATKSALKAPKGMKLLCVEEDAMDETGAHDLYVFSTDKIAYTEVESLMETKEAASTPAPA